MRYRVLILLLILGCSMDLAPDNGKTDFIYSVLEIVDRIFSQKEANGRNSCLFNKIWYSKSGQAIFGLL